MASGIKLSGVVSCSGCALFLTNVDVVCLQEIHCVSSAECLSWFSSSGFSSVVSPDSAHSCGNIVLLCFSLSLVNSWCDVDGRLLQCEFSFLGKSFRVCSV